MKQEECYNSYMKTVNISYLKNNLSAIIAKLNAYGAVFIVDRDRPVAVLTPSNRYVNEKDDHRLKALSKKGLLIHQTNPLDSSLLKERPPKPKESVDAVSVLIEERESTL